MNGTRVHPTRPLATYCCGGGLSVPPSGGMPQVATGTRKAAVGRPAVRASGRGDKGWWLGVAQRPCLGDWVGVLLECSSGAYFARHGGACGRLGSAEVASCCMAEDRHTEEGKMWLLPNRLVHLSVSVVVLQ